MSKGYDLGVDLFELWYAGKTLLPDVAEQFHLAGGSLSSGASSNPCYRGGGIGTDGTYGAGTAIAALGSTLNDYVATTYNNLYYVGLALIEQANDYADTDAAARDEFEKRKKELG
jgi:hypothetical protein